MPTSIFVNLPIEDLDRSKAFFQTLGYTVNEQFTDAKAACIVISETIYVMLLTKPFYRGFLSKDLCDTATHNEVILALSVDDRDGVDAMVARALAAGGRAPLPPRDHGFMYQHGFEDPDGHVWEVFWMDPTVPQ